MSSNVKRIPRMVGVLQNQVVKEVTKKKKPNTHTMLIGQLPLWLVKLTQWLLDHTREKERSIPKMNVSHSLH